MDKEQFIKWRENGGKIYKYVYEVETGKEDLRKSECEVDAVYEDGFKTFGFGYHIPFDCFEKWKMQHWSSNSYEYFIFLTNEQNIDDYLGEIKKCIAEGLQKEIRDLQKSLALVV